MKKKIVMILVAFWMVATAQAQWRVGVTGGAAYNVFNMDQQYMTDYKVDGRWGVTLGITGQYNVTDWLGVRADLNWTQKNYRHSRVVYSDVDYKLTSLTGSLCSTRRWTSTTSATSAGTAVS